MRMDAYLEYEWKTYPKDVLNMFMKKESIGALARAFAGHTVDHLLESSINMFNKLFSNMGSVPSGCVPAAIPNTDDVKSVGSVANEMNQRMSPTVNPSGPIFFNAGTSYSMTQKQAHNQYGHGGGGESSGDMSFFFGKNSIIAQMNDATGKAKSQQVIVFESFANKVEIILESFKSRERTVVKMCDMMEAIIERGSYEDEELSMSCRRLRRGSRRSSCS